jgi:hypothetical protein
LKFLSPDCICALMIHNSVNGSLPLCTLIGHYLQHTIVLPDRLVFRNGSLGFSAILPATSARTYSPSRAPCLFNAEHILYSRSGLLEFVLKPIASLLFIPSCWRLPTRSFDASNHHWTRKRRAFYGQFMQAREWGICGHIAYWKNKNQFSEHHCRSETFPCTRRDSARLALFRVGQQITNENNFASRYEAGSKMGATNGESFLNSLDMFCAQWHVTLVECQ